MLHLIDFGPLLILGRPYLVTVSYKAINTVSHDESPALRFLMPTIA
jgi:hypothetical protein